MIDEQDLPLFGLTIADCKSFRDSIVRDLRITYRRAGGGPELRERLLADFRREIEALTRILHRAADRALDDPEGPPP